MFTQQRHYKAIAEIIRSNKDLTNAFASMRFTNSRIKDIALGLADHFEADNLHFNREQFLKACGL